MVLASLPYVTLTTLALLNGDPQLLLQVTCSEKLRIQVSTLKSLLDSDNAKVRMAMKELDRLKQLLKEKDLEKAVLERVSYISK